MDDHKERELFEYIKTIAIKCIVGDKNLIENFTLHLHNREAISRAQRKDIVKKVRDGPLDEAVEALFDSIYSYSHEGSWIANLQAALVDEDCPLDKKMIQLLTEMLKQKSVPSDARYLINSWSKLEEFREKIIQTVQSSWTDAERTLTESNWILTLILKCYTEGAAWTSEVVTGIKETLGVESDEFRRSHEKISKVWAAPRKTGISSCTWKDGVVAFSWKSLPHANSYQLCLRDEFLDENLAPDQYTEGCYARVPLSDELRYGKVCMARVIGHAEKDAIYEMDWKAFLLGGNEVPRNVTAALNRENPTRAVNIMFDQPRRGAAEKYKITAIPEYGRKKTKIVKAGNVVFKYLRSRVSYVFEVSAEWDGKWTISGQSNSVITGSNKEHPMLTFQNIQGAAIDMSGASFAAGYTTLNFFKGDNFGKARDVRFEIASRGNIDYMILHWKVPAFQNFADNYEVKQFKVELREKFTDGGRKYLIEFIEEKFEYSTDELELELGNTYTAAVSTMYEDIDEDRPVISESADIEVCTRPSKPQVICHEIKSDCLKIEWNVSMGAKRYQLQLVYMEDCSLPSFSKDMGKETQFTKYFDEAFGYGTTYHAVITAFGITGRSSSYSTIAKTIGGSYVPTNVIATANHPKVADQNTQVYLSWTAPKQKPKSYVVLSVPAVSSMKTDIFEESCLVTGLRGGTEYFFKVKAVHVLQDRKEVTSGGCASRRIKTNPTPTQIKSVWTTPGINPSTSVDIRWEKLDAEMENESTKYRIHVRNADEKTRREEHTTSEWVKLEGLTPGTSFFATVAGGNSMGYGRDSERIQFQTALGTPQNLQLINNPEQPSTSLIVEFMDAEGEAPEYIGLLVKYHQGVREELGRPEKIQSGFVYTDLEPNTKYSVQVHASFSYRSGPTVHSKEAITAPSRAKLIEHRCSSSKELYARWVSDSGCELHQVKIICGPTGSTEKVLHIERENKTSYCCEHEATLYIIKVRSQNASGFFGEWSDECHIILAPAKVRGTVAELDEDGDIIVSCQVARTRTHATFYFMQAICDGNPVSRAIQEYGMGGIVKWRFTPTTPSESYMFEIWAKNSDRIQGETALSNSVVSRPLKAVVETVGRLSEFPSTDIKISWRKQQCTLYEVAIRAKDQSEPECLKCCDDTQCLYRCRSPGDTYLISVVALCGSVRGERSDEHSITLAPAEVVLVEDPSQLTGPVKQVQVKWEALDIMPEGYLVELFSDSEKLREEKTVLTQQTFQNSLKPGSQCHCIVTAFNGDIFGTPKRTKNYHIEWSTLSYFNIRPDDSGPSQKFKMIWECPDGANSFKLVMENNQTGTQHVEELSKTEYVFDKGIPNNTYTVRLYWGRGGCFGTQYLERTITMQSDPPTDLTVTPCMNYNGLQLNFHDTSRLRKKYEICAWPARNPDLCQSVQIDHCTHTLKDLLPGESYHVSVTSIINDTRSRTVCCPTAVQTYPALIGNLGAKYENRHIVFKWDPLEIAPDEYTVEWSCDHGSIADERTREPRFSLSFVQPAHVYKLRVAAVNSAGRGPKSEWLTFITEPHSVRNVRASQSLKNPSSLFITFDNHPGGQKVYTVKAIGTLEGTEEKLIETRENQALIQDIDSSGTYDITVQADFLGKKSETTHFLYDGGKMQSVQQDSTPKSNRRGNQEARVKRKQMQTPPSEGNSQSIRDKDTGMVIHYDLRNRVRAKSNVFITTRPDAVEAEEVILKIIEGVSTNDKNEVKNFKLVTRPENIVKYYSSGICDYDGKEAIYILMEKCDTDTLWERLKAGRDVAYQKRKFDMRSIGEGIRYMHQRRIVHRDLKPHNILYKDGLPVISDFGLSKKLPDAKSNIPQSVENVGTDGWRAPETGDKNPVTTKASDIYSYGLVSHYVLTNGKHPYGEDPRKWHTYIDDDVNGTKMDLDALNGLPDGQLSKDLIRNTLKRNPGDRPTIAEVLSHPFLWDDRRKLEFLSDACKYRELVEGLKKNDAARAGIPDADPPPMYLSLDDKIGTYAEQDMTDWKEHLDFSAEEHQEFKNKAGCDVKVDYMKSKVNKKAGDCVSGLTRFVRNRYAHDHEDKAEHVDMTNEELWAFFNKRYPFLLLFVYYKIKDHFVGKCSNDKDFSDTMARYFNQ